MSASKRPIFKFFFAKDTARFTETVDFPTPPFPDPTTTIFLIMLEEYKYI